MEEDIMWEFGHIPDGLTSFENQMYFVDSFRMESFTHFLQGFRGINEHVAIKIVQICREWTTSFSSIADSFKQVMNPEVYNSDSFNDNKWIFLNEAKDEFIEQLSNNNKSISFSSEEIELIREVLDTMFYIPEIKKERKTIKDRMLNLVKA